MHRGQEDWRNHSAASKLLLLIEKRRKLIQDVKGMDSVGHCIVDSAGLHQRPVHTIIE
jgi:hypothetical protein